MLRIRDIGQLTLRFSAPRYDGDVSRVGLRFSCCVNIIPTFFIGTVKEHRNVVRLTFNGSFTVSDTNHIYTLVRDAPLEIKDRLDFNDNIGFTSQASHRLIAKVAFYEIVDYISDKLDELYDASRPMKIDTKVPVKEIPYDYVVKLIEMPDPPFDEDTPPLEMIWVPEKGEIIKIEP